MKQAMARSTILVASAAALSGCLQSTGHLVRVDDTQGALAPAAIHFTQPSVFGRESLIADRIRENQYLEARLANTTQETFGSQVMRDVQTISTLTANLGISFDPLAKQSIARAQSLNDLQQQIDVVKFQAELLRVKKQLDELQQGAGTGPAAPGAITQPTPGTTKADTQKILDTLSSLADKLSVPTNTAKSTSTPELTFRDQLAYRAEVRSAIAANALDDTHDVSGNTLYRLALRVQVLPGAEDQRNKWGFARFVFQPPKLSQQEADEEVTQLYYDWLAFLNGRLAAASLDYNVRNNALTELKNLARSSKFFTLVPVMDDAGRCYFKAGVPPGARSAGLHRQNKGADEIQSLRGIGPKEAAPANPVAGTGKSVGQTESFRAFVAKAASGCKGDDILVQGAEGFVAEPRQKAGKPTRQPDSNISLYYAMLTEARENKAIPREFLEFITKEDAAAAARVYSTMPVMRDQRMSSISSMLSAIQLAAGVSAALPSTGGSLDAGIGAASKAASRVDTVERIPAVISLSGQTGLERDPPWAGWVLGPQILVNPSDKTQEVELRHSVMPHEVAIDVAVPAWRGILDIDAQAAWVGTWTAAGGDVLKQLDDDLAASSRKYFRQHFTIPLAPTDASLAALTRRMNHRFRVAGLAHPAIYSVSPVDFKSCDEPVSFVVHGENLWRRPEAYLEGVKSDDVAVLPDMNGLMVKFDGKKFASRAGEKHARLSVFTREGEATAVRHSEGLISIEKCPAPAKAPAKPAG